MLHLRFCSCTWTHMNLFILFAFMREIRQSSQGIKWKSTNPVWGGQIPQFAMHRHVYITPYAARIGRRASLELA